MYEIVRYGRALKGEIATLQRHLWRGDVAANTAYFEWKYEQNPYVKEPLVYLALTEGRVVGMRGMYGSRWEVGTPSETFVVSAADDLVIAPDHRGRGLFARIMRTAVDDLAVRGFTCTFGLSPGPVTLAGSLATGWRVAGLMRPLHRETPTHLVARRLRAILRKLPLPRRSVAAPRSLGAAVERTPFNALEHRGRRPGNRSLSLWQRLLGRPASEYGTLCHGGGAHGRGARRRRGLMLPTLYGRVSRAGVMPLSWTMDHVGPMARTVRDVALMLGVCAGRDARDSTSSARPVPDYLAALDTPLVGVRAAVPDNYFGENLEPEVAAAMTAAIRTLQSCSVDVGSVRVPDLGEIASACNNPIVRTECAVTHARLLREHPEDLQPVVRSRAELGFAATAVDYVYALRLRPAHARDFIAAAFASADVVVTPMTAEPPPTYATVTSGTMADVVARLGAFTRFTRVFNAIGLPALSLPCGFTAGGLPLAMQIVGRPFDEATVLRVAHAYEQATEWHRRRPPC